MAEKSHKLTNWLKADRERQRDRQRDKNERHNNNRQNGQREKNGIESRVKIKKESERFMFVVVFMFELSEKKHSSRAAGNSLQPPNLTS